MAGGVTASVARGRAGKFKKPTRGGGKKFSRGLQPLDADGNAVSMWAEEADENEPSDEDAESDEDAKDNGEGAASGLTEEATRAQRKAEKKARKDAAIAKARGKTVEVGDMPSSDEQSEEDDDEEEEDGDMPANPNHSKAARNQAMAPRDDVEEVTEGVSKMAVPQSRREREAQEAAIAKENYMRLHAQGKTDEAKSDLARLKLIREQRATEAARRQAVKEEKDSNDKARKEEIEAREAKLRANALGTPAKKGKKK